MTAPMTTPPTTASPVTAPGAASATSHTYTMRQQFAATVSDLLDGDPRTVVVLADIGYSNFVETGAVARHPERVINVGIREQLMIGVAAGLALEGMRPIVHSYTPFLIERPFEQIKLDLGHQGVGAVLVSIGASYDAAAEGRTHQAPEDVALMSTLPGWEIHVPGHPGEVDRLLRTAASADTRVYIRLAEDMNQTAAKPTVESGGPVVVRRAGADTPTVIAVGPMLDPVLAATADLDVGAIYLVTVKPLDPEVLRRLVTSTEVVIVEPLLEGTSAGPLATALSDRPRRITAIGVPRAESRNYGTRHAHASAHGLDVEGLRTRISTALS